MAAYVLIIVGNVVCATANSMNVFIIGSVLMGVGAGLGELISLAVTGEIAPTKNRGIYIGGMIMTILPFCPAVLYAQLVTYAGTVSGLIGLNATRTRGCKVEFPPA